MAPAKPSLELLRSLSDEHVLRALMIQRRATRAELALATGLSKPTVAESVRRLSTAGVVVDMAGSCAGPVRLAVVSAADPVDRETGRLVELPDAPFLVGELDAPAVLLDVVDGPVIVDNDVNWMARAEHGHDDFVYVYLGEGVGAAVVSDGDVRRGHAGVAGEIAHVVTV